MNDRGTGEPVRVPAREGWPVPGRPETYSAEYHELHRLLTKQMANEPLTPDEAGLVWNSMHALAQTIPEGGLLTSLYRQLCVETHTGQRCSVCGRHSSENYDCRYEC